MDRSSQYVMVSGGTAAPQNTNHQPSSSPSKANKRINMAMRNRPGYLDFKSRDHTGNASTPEAQLKDYLFDQSAHSPVGIIAKGQGGTGKTFALRAISHLEETKARFPGGVLFASLGESARVRVIVDKLAMFVTRTGGQSVSNTIIGRDDLSEALTTAARWFENRICLFIFDDLWKVNDIPADILVQLRVLAAHKHSRVASSTRDSSFASDAHVTFRPRETFGTVATRMLLLKAHLPHPDITTGDYQAFRGVLELCTGLPLFIDLAGSSVRYIQEKSCRSNPQLAWSKYCSEELVSVGGDIRNVLSKTLSVINQTFARYSIQDRFSAFAIVRKTTQMPELVFARVWHTTRKNARDILDAFERFSVIRIDLEKNSGVRLIQLHDLIIDFAVSNCNTASCLRSICDTLVVSYYPQKSSVKERNNGEWQRRTLASFDKWWLDVVDDGFIQNSIVWIMYLAERRKEMNWLTTKARWIISRSEIGGWTELQGDLELVQDDVGMSVQGHQSDKREFTRWLNLLRLCVRHSSRALDTTAWGGMPWFMLYGHLVNYTEPALYVVNFLKELETYAPRPWVRPNRGLFVPFGDKCLHTWDFDTLCLCMSMEETGNLKRVFGLNRTGVHIGHLYKKEIKVCWTETLERHYCENALEDGYGIGISCSSDGSTAVVRGVEGTLLVLKASGNGPFRDEPEDTLEGGNSQHTAHRSNNLIYPLLLLKGLGLIYRKLILRRNDSRTIEGQTQKWVETSSGWKTCVFRSDDEKVEDVGLSDDGRYIVTVSNDETVRLWNMANPSRVEVVGQLGEEVIGVAVNTNGKRIVSGCADRNVYVWCRKWSGWRRSTLQGHSAEVSAVAINPRGTVVVSGSVEGDTLVWKLRATGRWTPVELKGHKSRVRCVMVTKDGNCVATGRYDGTTDVWKVRDRRWERCMPVIRHEGAVDQVATNSDVSQILSCSVDRTIRLWEIHDGSQESHCSDTHDGLVTSYAVSADGYQVVSTSLDGTIRIWEQNGDSWRATIVSENEMQLQSVALSADGQRVAAARGRSHPRVWQKNKKSWDCTMEYRKDGYCVDVSRNGKRIIIGSFRHLVVCDEHGGSWEQTKLAANEMRTFFACVTLSGNGCCAAAGDLYGKVFVLRKRDLRWNVSLLGTYTQRVSCVGMNKDGARLALCCDGVVHVWEQCEAGWQRCYDSHRIRATSVRFVRDDFIRILSSYPMAVGLVKSVKGPWVTRNEAFHLENSIRSSLSLDRAEMEQTATGFVVIHEKPPYVSFLTNVL